MIKQHIILLLLWSLFSFLHSAFASETWKMKMESAMKKKYKYYRMIYSFFAFASLISVIYYHFSIKTFTLWNANEPEKIISIFIIITGFVLMMMFTRKFFFDLSGADIFLKSTKADTLIDTSFYKYVRHPLYSATLIFVWGIFLLQPLLSNLISCICITVYTLIGIIFEERKLMHLYGDTYLEYKSKTPMLIPKLKHSN